MSAADIVWTLTTILAGITAYLFTLKLWVPVAVWTLGSGLWVLAHALAA